MMQRFIQVLLLAACTLLLLPSSLATEAEVLHPLIASVESSPLLQEDTVIRGLMKRQSCASNYYLCDGQGCCPLGWACCQTGRCCSPNYYCVWGSNGKIGCCPDGVRCSGPVP